MPYRFEATKDYLVSEQKIKTLIYFAKQEDKKGNDENRVLFLKLGVVILVTRFQVYVEKALAEFEYELKQANKLNGVLPLHLRLYSLKLHSEKNSIHGVLTNPLNFSKEKLTTVKSMISLLNEFCNDNGIIPSDLKFDTKFPLGKQGLNELKNLFKQIEGKNIFEDAKFDINKLNEILSRRHNIIHEDANEQLTELKVKEYQDFISRVVKHIDKYLVSARKRRNVFVSGVQASKHL